MAMSLANADDLRHVFKGRWHRLRLGWGGKHPDHRPDNRPITAWKPRTRSPNSRETDCRHALASWSSALHGGQTARRLEHPQSTQERGLTIEALAHQAHVSAAWLGEEFKNGQAPAASARRIDPAAIPVR